MSLTHETTILHPGYRVGDVKTANYNITFTANQLVEPTSDLGWFLLNGSVLSQSTYPLLFARYGTTFNTGGEGTGNFRLPNYSEGVFPVAAGLTNFTTFGVAGGEINHVLSTAELASHTHTDTKTFTANSHSHTGSLSANDDDSHAHSYTRSSPVLSTHGGSSSVATSTTSYASGTGGNFHAHTINSLSYGSATETYTKSGGVSAAGSSTAHNNMMPYIIVGGLLVKHD